MDEAQELVNETPLPSSTDIMTAISEMRTEISDMRGEISNIRTAIHDDVIVRVERMEQIIETLPTVYASADSLNKVKTSQAGYEAGLRQVTGQLADVLNMQADSKAQFTTIESRLNELSGVKNLLSEFMDTQRERLNNQQTTINEVKAKTETLVKDVAFQKTDLEDTKTRLNVHFTPLQDYVLGSPTQEGLKTTFGRVFTEVHELRSSVSQQSAEYAIIGEYVKTQKTKEESHIGFRRRIYLQMFTKTGFALVVGSIFLLIVLAQSIDLERSFVWLRNAAALFGFKVG